jgi:hypothetical protein
MGWVNELTRTQFEAALTGAGWRVMRSADIKRGPTNIQVMFACARDG